jgi:hypothetical protein
LVTAQPSVLAYVFVTDGEAAFVRLCSCYSNTNQGSLARCYVSFRLA